MSIQDLEKALKIVKENPGKVFFAGPRSPLLVAKAEKALAVRFPPTYKRFLLECGAGNFGSKEFYGVIDETFVGSEVPNGIWFTLFERENCHLPKDLVVIGSTGDGDFYCLKIENDKEAPVIIYQPGVPDEEQLGSKVAEDFGRFFLQQIESV